MLDKIHAFSRSLGMPGNEFVDYAMALHGQGKLTRLKPHLDERNYLELESIMSGYTENRDAEESSGQDACAHISCIEVDAKHIAEKDTRHVKSSDSQEVHNFKLARGETIAVLKPLLLSLLECNRVVCIRGDTGCGKSTLVPQFLLEQYGTVVCTQPRRLAAISLAKYVRRTLGMAVGYKVRFEEDFDATTRLFYVTDGMLLRNRMRNDILIVDEAHERTVNIDVLLAMGMKMVIMSATLDDEIAIFFRCPLINIEVERFPIKIFYLKNDVGDYLKETIETTELLCMSKKYKEMLAERVSGVDEDDHRKRPRTVGCPETETLGAARTGDVLVFLPGQEDINHACKHLRKSLPTHVVIPLHSTVQSPMVFTPMPKPKIILSTNIAETSLTLDVDYVVDCGYFKQKNFSQIDTLLLTQISRSQATQRAGRVGRIREGAVYRIYTKKGFMSMHERTEPEMLRVNLCNVALLLISLDVNFEDLVNPLPRDRLAKALHFLEEIGALRKNRLTEDGRRMSRLPVHVQCAKTLIVAERMGILEDAVVIASMLSVPNIIKGSLDESAAPDQGKLVLRKYEHPKGDHLTLLTIYSKWVASGYSPRFLETNGLNVRNMQQVRKVKDQLMTYFGSNAEGPALVFDKALRDESIQKAFLTGFGHNVAKRRGDAYISMDTGNLCYIHPTSTLYGRSPEYVLFNELVLTKREYMRWCLALDAELLANKL